ncbi:hypothetical protein [Desulfotignum phosphitoxidans]|uniref:Uncharacterized protein n=1 Tax=Desulfotignum phosphitoxidans DSM 13687 TaxID=1286635 RepID=S0G5Q2_9BACT|nr:hypothetical protein [Desulfotignum phosphitoxidans]EMS81234.1 hypothetical protein Dpo_1c03740 [Desulfotignum phosphitoxidans DSM 13687]
MAQSNCSTCRFRKKYDDNPASLLGRLWRWHTNWCPGWKRYMTTLSEKERKIIANRYDMPKFK